MSHCIHYGVCGGCAYTDGDAPDKRDMIVRAMEQAGYDAPSVAPLQIMPLQTRRRADLGIERRGATIALGLHQRGGGPVVDMRECVLLEPRLFGLLAPLRILLRSLEALRRAGDVVVTALDTGFDVLIRPDGPLTAGDRTRMIAFAHTHGLARISVAMSAETPEPVAILVRPEIGFAGVRVEPPAGAFLQASRAGETAIVTAMLAALPRLTRKSLIVELFAGVGTLSLPLAQVGRVAAYEGDAAAAGALQNAVRAQNLAGRISVAARDLFRRPVQGADLAVAAAVVLDPPFAGAGAQMRFLAAAPVARIIYISCNPVALMHDAAQLRHSGYKLLNATPIDQFRYADHIEAVAAFSRG